MYFHRHIEPVIEELQNENHIVLTGQDRWKIYNVKGLHSINYTLNTLLIRKENPSLFLI